MSDNSINEDNSENEINTNSKALKNIKNSLEINENQKNKIFFSNNNKFEENENNIQIDENQKISFNDVMKNFGQVENETKKANLSKAYKTYINNKEKSQIEIKFNDTKDKEIERTQNYNLLNKEISKYQKKVKENREADIIDFTQENDKIIRKISKKTVKEIVTGLNEENNFEKKINNILINNHCDTDVKILENENNELMKIDPEESKRRYQQLKKFRALSLQKEIENQRKNRIKAKLYHKIKKSREQKEEKAILEQLQTIDKEAVENYLNKKKMNRAKERMTLKHSINSKFLQTVKRYHIDKDKQGKENIKENYKIRDELLKKVKGENSDDEEDYEYEENEEEKNEDNNNMNDNNNVDYENNSNNVILDFEDKNKKKKIENNNNEENDYGVFSMPFMKKAENNESLQEKIKSMKNKMENENEEYFEESESNSNSDSSEEEKEKNINNNLNNKNNNKNPKNKKLKNITSSDINKISNEAKEILKKEEKEENIKINLTPNELQKIINEDEIKADVEQFNKFIIENEENKKEFLENENKERIDKIRKENPEFMSGWGSWTGESKEIKAKEFLKKKRYEEKIKRLTEISNNESDKNPFIKINKSIDKKLSNYLVQKLPNNIQSIEQFEKLNGYTIGREWNTLTMYKKMIQPKIISKIGQIIQPMNLNDHTKAQKIVDIIEKATKKKNRTKTKL